MSLIKNAHLQENIEAHLEGFSYELLIPTRTLKCCTNIYENNQHPAVKTTDSGAYI